MSFITSNSKNQTEILPEASIRFVFLSDDIEFMDLADSCCNLNKLPPNSLKYPSEDFLLTLTELNKGKKSAPHNWLSVKGRTSSKFSHLLSYLKSLADNELIFIFVKYHEKIFELGYKMILKVAQKVKDPQLLTTTDLFVKFMNAVDLLEKFFYLIPIKLSQGWKQNEFVSVLSLILDHGNNSHFRIYGFRLLLLYINSLLGKIPESVCNLFKNSIIIQSFIEEDLFRKDSTVENIINSLHLTPNSSMFDFGQISIQSNLLPNKSIYPIEKFDSPFYMSTQSVIATRMIQEFFYNTLYISHFVVDDSPLSDTSISYGYLTGKYSNFVHVPSKDAFRFQAYPNKHDDTQSIYDNLSVYLITPEDAENSLSSILGLGGVPIPLMRMMASFLLKYVSFIGKELNYISDFSGSPVLNDKLNIMTFIPTQANDFEYPEKLRKYQQHIWFESNKSLSIFSESVVFGILKLDKATITSSGYNPMVAECIYQDIMDTQMATLNIFRSFLLMDVSRRPAQFVKPIEDTHLAKWSSLMLKYLSSIFFSMSSNVAIQEPWTFSRFSAFYLSVTIFRTLFKMSDNEIPLNIKDASLSHLFEILESMLIKPVLKGEDPSDPYCLGSQAIMILFECIVEGWLITFDNKPKYWVKFEKIFFIESPWNTRYHVWANVLQSLTMTLGTRFYNIDHLELLQDYLFSGQRTKGGSRGLKKKFETIQKNIYISIRNGDEVTVPFSSYNPFIVTSKCSLISSQIVLDYLWKKKELREKDFNYVLNTIKSNQLSSFSETKENAPVNMEESRSNLSEFSETNDVPSKEENVYSSNLKYNLDSCISVNSLARYKNSALDVNLPNVVQDSYNATSPLPLSKNISPNVQKKHITLPHGKHLTGPNQFQIPGIEPNTSGNDPEGSNFGDVPEKNKLFRTSTIENRYSASYLKNEYDAVMETQKMKNPNILHSSNTAKSLSLTPSGYKFLSQSPGLMIKNRIKSSNLHKRSASVFGSIVNKFKINRKKLESSGGNLLNDESSSEKETIIQLERLLNLNDDHLNEWILVRTPFFDTFNLDSDLNWDLIFKHIKINVVWSKWWQLVERPMIIRDLGAKKIVTTGLSRAWDIYLILTDRQTATGVSFIKDEKLAFAHWLFELCRGPQDSDECSILAMRAISRVFCRTFSPNYSIPSMYQALFYRIVLESLSEKALEFEYGVQLLEVTLIECKRMFALDVPGCLMVVKSLTGTLLRIFSPDFSYSLSDEAIFGATILLISSITLLHSSPQETFEKNKITPTVTFTSSSDSVVAWEPFDRKKTLDQLCYLLLKLAGEHSLILKNVSDNNQTRIVCKLIGTLSVIILMNNTPDKITENAINLIISFLFSPNKQYVFVALDSLRALLASNEQQKILDLLGHKLAFLITKFLVYCCYEQLDRYVDTSDSHYIRVFGDSLYLLMSYITLVPSIISGRNFDVDSSERMDLEVFLFKDLLQDRINELYSKPKPLALHKYNYAISMTVMSSKSGYHSPHDILTELEKLPFILSPEYKSRMKDYSPENAPELNSIKQLMLAYSFSLIQNYKTYNPKHEFIKYLNDSSIISNELDGIANGDEMMFFGYGTSIISVIKPKLSSELKITTRSVTGKHAGYFRSDLVDLILSDNMDVVPQAGLEKEISNFLKSNPEFNLKNLVPSNKVESEKGDSSTEDTDSEEHSISSHGDDLELEFPKVRFISSYDADWVSYKASAANEFCSENEKIERLVSNTKKFVFSYKSKEEIALLNVSKGDPKVFSKSEKREKSIFQELRLFLQHFGFFDWTSSNPKLFKLLLPSNNLFKELSLLDRLTPKECIKVAICYVAPNQTTESEILSNDKESASLAFREFVQSLGYPVTLKNFGGYTGKLSTDGSDGETAPIYVTHNTVLVFHDATEMPTDKNDPKQLKKKRHIGNDFVHIIWNENFCDYRPETITGDFGNAQIHIRPLLSNLGSYGISLYADQRIDAIGPLVDNMIVGPELLSDIVRSWAICANRQSLWMRSPVFYSPLLVRMDSINQIISKNLFPEWSEKTYSGSFLINPGVVAKLSSDENQHSSNIGDSATSKKVDNKVKTDTDKRAEKIRNDQTIEQPEIEISDISMGLSNINMLNDGEKTRTHTLEYDEKAAAAPNKPPVEKEQVTLSVSETTQDVNLKTLKPKPNLGYFNKSEDDIFVTRILSQQSTEH
ncbi:hypothetical protein BB560_000209 [Smittium megazygosporum]|uniref:Rap-GAP domain-containing protein n=1 Tax=Smittium megazygosporum TaxID=133381 RepID=A0A2T9ZKX6_9FUNG|nr:hypothetical protein BB560_000209 [Smittium megazygosporum]